MLADALAQKAAAARAALTGVAPGQWDRAIYDAGRVVAALAVGVPLVHVDVDGTVLEDSATSTYVGGRLAPRAPAPALVSRLVAIREMAVLLAGGAVLVASGRDDWDKGVLGEATAAVRQADELLTAWGHDAEVQAAILRAARGWLNGLMTDRVTRACIVSIAAQLAIGACDARSARALGDAIRATQGLTRFPDGPAIPPTEDSRS